MALTEKQKRFADEYLIDLNATQAAIRAGYAKRSARQAGASNMKRPAVRELIDRRMAEKERELIAEQDEILRFLTEVLRGTATGEEVVVEGSGNGVSEARVLEKLPGLRDKLEAAKLLGKRYGIYSEGVDLKGQVPVVIVDDITE